MSDVLGTPQTPGGDLRTAAAGSPVDAPRSRGRRKVRDGVVVGDKMEKTVIVVVQELKPHPLYKKVVRATRRFKVHDQENSC
jgi:small subunit ribosomal protein S17